MKGTSFFVLAGLAAVAQAGRLPLCSVSTSILDIGWTSLLTLLQGNLFDRCHRHHRLQSQQHTMYLLVGDFHVSRC